MAINIIKEISSHTKVKIILGNHDIQFKNRLDIHSLTAFEPYADIIDDITEQNIKGKDILFSPWLATDEQKEKFVKQIKSRKYDVCYGHFEINGFELSKGCIEEQGLNSKVFSKCDKVYSGHFHIRNRIKNIAYIGSPYQMNMGDAQTHRGFEVLDLDTMKNTFYQNKISPKFKKILYSEVKRKDLNKNKIKGNFVKIYFDEEVSENEVLKYTEKIESFGILRIDHETSSQFLSNSDEEEMEGKDLSNLSDFFKGFIDMLNPDDVPDEIDKDILFKKIEKIAKEIEE